MLDDIRHGLKNSGYSYKAIARATDGAVSERTVYGLFSDDANPTVNTLDAIGSVLAELPDSQRRPCDGCRHLEDILDDGVALCRLRGPRPDHGCAMRRS